MEAMLTCWCQQQRTRYKQGLNEVLAPFLFLQTEPEEMAPSDDEVYACFAGFLRRFAPFFYSDDFVPLQCAFVFFRRLLLYHRPDLHNLLVERGVTPDMFCMPWFLTLFASKTPLRLTLQLWDRHLERGEPPFFVFLAVAVLAGAEKAILQAESSQLPEIITSLGVSSRGELESLWSMAEALYNSTPATFVARLRRNVLRSNFSCRGAAAPKPSEDAAESEDAAAIRLLESLEKEKCFFILPEEVVGHCYPPRPGDDKKPWQPSPLCPWRLLVLDVRPSLAFEASRLPAALAFDPSEASMGGSQAEAPPGAAAGDRARGSPWSAGKRWLQWGLEPAADLELDPPSVFEALKSTLGEHWVCDREAHICLLGGQADAPVVKALYELLTKRLTLRHVSVASGGYESVVACARRQGFEVVESAPAPALSRERRPAGRSSETRAPAAAQEEAQPYRTGSAAAAAAPDSGAPASLAQPAQRREVGRSSSDGDGHWGRKLTKAWSSIKRQASSATASTSGVCASVDVAGQLPAACPAPTPVAERATSACEWLQPAAGGEADGGEASSGPAHPPGIRDTPGNWPRSAELATLPRCPRTAEDLQVPGAHWPCTAIFVRHPLAPDGSPTTTPWQGCRGLLAFHEGHLVCVATCDLQAPPVLMDVEVGSVAKVTSKKQAPDILMFYLKEDVATPAAAAGTSSATPAAVQRAASTMSAASSLCGVGGGGSAVAMVLHFLGGAEAGRHFIKALKTRFQARPEPRLSATPVAADPPSVPSAKGASCGKGKGSKGFPTERPFRPSPQLP